MELARKLPFLAVVMALLTLSVGSLVISQGMVGAQTDPGVGTDARSTMTTVWTSTAAIEPACHRLHRSTRTR